MARRENRLMKQAGAGCSNNSGSNGGAGSVLDHGEQKVTVATEMIDPSLFPGQTVSDRVYQQ